MIPVERLFGAPARRGAGNPVAAQRALTDFGAGLLRAGAHGTTVLSPWSLFSVLAMARVGARGGTAAQLDALLGLDLAGQASAVTAVDAGIAAALSAAVADPVGRDSDSSPYVVQAANEMWVQRGLPVRQEFLDAVATDGL